MRHFWQLVGEGSTTEPLKKKKIAGLVEEKRDRADHCIGVLNGNGSGHSNKKDIRDRSMRSNEGSDEDLSSPSLGKF